MLKRAPHCRRATGSIYVLCLSVLALAGCVASPPAPSAAVPVVAVPTVWAAPAGSAASAATAAAPVDLTSWWRSFEDPELDALIARSLGAAPDLEACAARVRAVRAMAQASNASLGPQLSLVGMPQQSPDGRDNYFQSGIAGQWNVAFSQRRSALKGLAEAELQIALADEQAARATLVAEVARTYFEMRAAERDQQLLNQMVALADERARITRVLWQTRQVSTAEVDAAAVVSVQVRAAAAQPAAETAQARLRLAVLLGDLQAKLPAPAASAAPAARVALGLSALPADLVRQRPGVRRAEQSVFKAAHATGLARADAQPQISLLGFVGLNFLVSGPASSSLRGVFSAGPAFSMPLFDGGQREANQSARHAEFDGATALYRKEVMQAVAEAQAALLQLDLERQRMAAAVVVEDTALRRADSTDAQARAGLADGLQRTEARRAALQASRDSLRSALAEQVAYVDLFTAFGGAALPTAAP
jgi:NodT family efflux transporter outer membrane factor (OMF) lipoprotein